MPELLGLPYSPWSEKARWALEARKVAYTKVVYAPLVGELGLRRRLGKWSGTVSVPVLFDDDGRGIPDSLAIARWADGRGEGPALVPASLEGEVVRYVELSEAALDAGRAVSLHRMLADDEALKEMVPRALRSASGPLAPAVAAFGIRRTLRKYGAGRIDVADHERRLVALLDGLRATLAGLAGAPAGGGGGPKTLLGTFTFADIAMTQALTFVEPPSFGVKIGASSRRSFTHDVLRERYADLLAWRDAVYDAYRPRG
jgi:glutathione S-transferase